MTLHRSGRFTVQLAVLLLLLLLPAGALQAQDANAAGATAVPANSLIPASAADTMEIVITARAVDTVRIEKDRFLGERRDAEARWTSLRTQVTQLERSIDEVRKAISLAQAKEKLAKKDKRDADRLSALAEKRVLERSLDLLDARYDLRRAQVEHARMLRDHLDASIRSDDAELAIAERLTQVVDGDPTQRPVFQELNSRWLQALRTQVARAYDLEDRRFKVVEAQIRLLKRQRD